ncbi:MAG: response regulator [Actinobacteria bacterium]|nr:MAG: response regulator [Actinomycetota bacterium]
MSERRRVLVVEDDPSFGSLLRVVLEAAGHEVKVVTTSAEALAAVESMVPDVLCVDIDLPDGTGWALLDEIEHRGIEPSRVVVASAGIGVSMSRHRPGTFLLPKPFPVDSLLRLVSGEELPEI